MKKLFSIFIVLFFTTICSAQPQAPDTLWTWAYGYTGYDFGNSVRQTSDGGFIIAGSTSSLDGDDILLIKTDALGNQQWSQTFGGNFSVWGKSIQQTSDGGYIITGLIDSSFTTNCDVYLIKTDILGNQQWSRSFGGIIDDAGNCVQQTSDGGYIIVGKTASYGAGNYDVYLIKTDAFGAQEWYQTFGMYDESFGNSVQQTSDGGYIIAGATEYLGPINCSIYLIKTDGLGNQQWYKIFGRMDFDHGTYAQQTLDGEYIVVGSTDSLGAGCCDVYLIKTDALGNQQWYQTFGGYNDDWGKSVQQTSDGGYIIIGVTYSFGAGYADVYLIRLESETGVEDFSVQKLPDNIVLCPAYPNPFNASTVISFDLRDACKVKLAIYNISGREVATLDTRHLKLGTNQVVWDANGQVSGIYFARIQAGAFEQVQKIVLLK